MLTVKDLALEGPKLLGPTRFEDERGYFQETFNQRDFAEAVGRDVRFVQDNESLSQLAGTVRGLHFQVAPSGQGKLVRVVAGRLLDVVVDIRAGSATFGEHLTIELDAVGGLQLWVPEGFAHGFCTLEPGTVLNYKVTDFYSAEHDRSISWCDPELGIAWPVGAGEAVVSDKDAVAPSLAELKEQGSVF